MIDVIKSVNLPILGVCLGHQAIAHAYGGRVAAAPRVMHGLRSRVDLTAGGKNDDIWRNINTGFLVVRYHSLAVFDLPECLEAQAWAKGEGGEEDCCMALRHTEKPMWGVQFHPESILSEQGFNLIANFARITDEHLNRPPSNYTPTLSSPSDIARPDVIHGLQPLNWKEATSWKVLRHTIPFPSDLMAVYEHLFYSERIPSAFLDSSMALGRPDVRFSILGGGLEAGPFCELLTYSAKENRRVTARHVLSGESSECHLKQDVSFFDVFNERVSFSQSLMEDQNTTSDCDFTGGWVGFCGYELGAEVHKEQNLFTHTSNDDPSGIDAGWMFLDRFLLVDHRAKTAELVCLGQDDNGWFAEMKTKLESFQKEVHSDPELPVDGEEVAFTLRDGREKYLQLVQSCVDAIMRGDSYELCLTTQFSSSWRPDPMILYKTLRISNPAPYQAFLSFGLVDDSHNKPFQLVSASPERFLRVSPDGYVKVKPMKGTSRRGKDKEEDQMLIQKLGNDDKERAENLMIVDLMRNDLSMVSDVGTVQCRLTELMQVETFASYHQLVSTVRAKLRADTTPVDALRKLFPAGSMTGAPKIRSIQLLEKLEGAPRGAYSGVLGYVSQLGKATNLAVMIRTVVLSSTRTSLGAGGAITALSDPAAEYEEMLVKCRPALRALAAQAPGRKINVRCPNSDDALLTFEPLSDLPLALVSQASFPIDSDVTLFETMFISPTPNAGFDVQLLPYHQDRLERSCAAKGFACPSIARLTQTITDAVQNDYRTGIPEPGVIARVDLTSSGELSVKFRDWFGNVDRSTIPPTDPRWSKPTFNLPTTFENPITLIIDPIPTNCQTVHKTSDRTFYTGATDRCRKHLDQHPSSDVLLHNPDGNLTETCIYSIAVQYTERGPWFTPPLKDGLLDGCARRYFLDQGMLKERSIPLNDLTPTEEYPRLIAFNSVRGVRPARILTV